MQPSLARLEFMSLWAGQAVSLCRSLPAALLVETLVRETQEALRQMEGALRA
ncbi:MAG: hypothetical protein NZN28_13805 [Meiothermus sp.]|uniref:hypothetical protein n=1 Tax=Meiothermus sp. TaxID=1955249 RepID=UPI0025D59A90|nr:hypothetical protein [Meiothermus sp.]MCS7069686.1 hypothetical protein [Meiothermus sp.]